MDSAKTGTQSGLSTPISYSGRWLIKSSQKILGPYQHERVVEMILSREVVSLDEVAKVAGRWKLVREEPHFMQAVEELNRRDANRKEDTSGTHSQTFSERMDQTQTILEEREPNLRLDERVQESKSKPVAVNVPTDSVRDAKDRQLRLMIFAAVVVVAAIVIVIEMQRSPSSRSQGNSTASSSSNMAVGPSGPTPESANESADVKLLNLGLAAERMGEIDSALKFYREAHELNPKNTDVRVRLAPLILKQDGQTVVAKRILQEAMAATPSNEQAKRGKTGLAFAMMMDSDYAGAARELEEALKLDPQFAPALFNLGMVEYLRQKYEAADQNFAKLYSLDKSQIAAELMSIRARFLMRKLSGDSGVAAKSPVNDNSDLEVRTRQLMVDHSDFRQEAGLIALQLVEARDKSPKREQDLKSLLQSVLHLDPLAGDEHVHDSLLFLDPISWTSTLSSYEVLIKEFESSSPEFEQAKALRALSVFKAGRKQEARQIIDDVLAKRPDSAEFLALKSAMMISMGQNDEAKAILKEIAKVESTLLPQILLMRVCADASQPSCGSLDLIRLVKSLQTDQIASIAILIRGAGIALSEKRTSDALALMARARKMAPNYAPLMQLDAKVASGGG